MKAMQFEKVGKPLQLVEREAPALLAHQILLSVKACGICRTDLHIIDGELNQPNLPLILGHQIVAEIKALGDDVTGFTVGQRASFVCQVAKISVIMLSLLVIPWMVATPARPLSIHSFALFCQKNLTICLILT